MSSGDLEWAAESLVEAERRQCVSRVVSVVPEGAVSKGDNYGSEIHRLKMTVVLHSGEVQQRSVIYKAMPESPHRRKAAKMFGSFSKEAKIFTDVLSELEVILREKEPHAELLWPEYYGAKRRYEGLLMEDLCAKGYKMGNRRKGMNFEHAALCLRSLAKFHALVAVLRERGDLNIKDYDSPFFANDALVVESFYENTFKDLATVLETKWKGEWAQYGERIRKVTNSITSNMKDMKKKESPESFYTLIHGDCWLNNMMFRYGRNGEPEAVKFMDFQLTFYNHPGFDLQYFLHTSLELEAKPRKMELLQLYHSSLEENLKFFEYGGAVPTHADILEYYKSVEYYGLGVALASMPFMLAPSEQAPDMEDMSEKFLKNEVVKVSIFDHGGETFIKSIQYVLKEAEENGLL